VTALTVAQVPPPAAAPFLDFQFGVEPRPGIWVPLPVLDGDQEVWTSRLPVETSWEGALEVRRSGDLLALIWRAVTTPADLARLTQRIYIHLLGRCREDGFDHLVRIWQFVPGMNSAVPGSGGDGYRAFCSGRARALAALALAADGLPAASAMGAPPDAPLLVIALASRHPVRHLENPRQVSAYRYPPEYAGVSPAFARATLLGDRLLISGTAAIVGHESQHVGDVGRQARCTVDNICVLLEHACAQANARRAVDLQARVYLRNPADLARVRAQVEATLPGLAGVLYLQAQVCRAELLVEIEATARLR
jgi:chorismate lyase/3-hydroxybenzoate synthase